MNGGAHVLLVDDSIVIRRLVADLLTADPEIASVATAANGRIALEKLSSFRPDLVILDLEMPELGGLDFLRALRKTSGEVPVLVFSALTERAGELTLEALSLGANDYVTKPANVGDILIPVEKVRQELLAKSRALLKSAPLRRREPAAATQPSTPPVSLQAPFAAIELLAIGASTGGPPAVTKLLTDLPEDLPVPIVIVQHMPPLFTKIFADRLDEQTHFRVREAIQGEELRPGEVWVAPGDFHVHVRRVGPRLTMLVDQSPPENSCRPAVDVLFRSAAEACPGSTLAVVLTGMGSDGLRGAEAIRATHGQVVVQDEASSQIWGMPGSVAKAGLADDVASLDRLASILLRRIRRSREVASLRGGGG